MKISLNSLALFSILALPNTAAQALSAPVIHQQKDDDVAVFLPLVGKNIDSRILGKWSRISDFGPKENEGGFIGKVTTVYEFRKDGTVTHSQTGVSCLGETRGKKITDTSTYKYVNKDGIIYRICQDSPEEKPYIVKSHYNQKSNRLSIDKDIYTRMK